MILSEFIEVKPAGKMIKYYQNLGYNAKHLVPLLINVKDLSNNSHERIDVICDICGKKTNSIYQNYYKITNGLTLPYYCSECSPKKVAENCMAEYGVSNHSKRPEVIQKIKDTFETRYGVSNAMEVPEFKERIQETVRIRYGVNYVMEVPEFKKRAKEKQMKYLEVHKEEHYKRVCQTMTDRYGVAYTFLLPNVADRAKEACFQKYGCKNPMELSEFREKARKTLYENGNCATSKQQKYLHMLYGGELNYALKMYNLDIYLPDDKLDIEFDGSGHEMSWKLGSITKEEFDKRTIIRNTTVKNAGIKRINIVSKSDKIPSDSTLLQMLQDARNYFSQYPEHSWIEFNISDSTMRNAENKQGIPYSYGELRTIKDTDLPSVAQAV